MIVKNIYLRILAGVFWIAIGLAFLKIYFDRNKDSIWGSIYRTGMDVTKEKSIGFDLGKVYLILGCLSVIGGLIAIIFGFRSTMVGR